MWSASLILYFCGPLDDNELRGQLVLFQAIIQPTIGVSFLSGAFLQCDKRHRNRRRSRHYHLRINARNRPIERPFRDPARQFAFPSTWKWRRRTPLPPRYGFSRLFWQAAAEGPYFWKPESHTYSVSDRPMTAQEKNTWPDRRTRTHPNPTSNEAPIIIPPPKPPYDGPLLVNTDDTQKVISRSNLRLDPIDGETIPQIVKSIPKDDACENANINEDSTQDAQHTPIMTTFNPTDLIGRSFLSDTQDGQRQRIKIIEAIDAHESLLYQDPVHTKFRCATDNKQFKKEREFVETSEDGQTIWKFKRITAHEGPLVRSHPNYNGSRYNLIVVWETGEITSEPLNIIAADEQIWQLLQPILYWRGDTALLFDEEVRTSHRNSHQENG